MLAPYGAAVQLFSSANALAGGLAVLVLAAPAAVPAAADGPARLAEHPRSFIGPDGTTYDSAPLTVPGRDGELYYGPDFDVACGLGSGTADGLRQVARLARVIEHSGRTVVWTIAPDKTTVVPDDLPEPMPHGACDSAGFDMVRRALDGVDDSSFLPLRARLAGSRHQSYFKTDTHWTTVGGSIFAKAVARRLAPKVARLQSYVFGTEQRVGNLNYFAGNLELETAETAMPTTRVKVRTARTSADQVWGGYPQLTYDYTWNSRPARRTVPGDTVVIGDSFTMFALDSLMPLFERGRFLWRGKAGNKTEFRAIKRADTVVIEVNQLLASLGSSAADPDYRKRLRRFLR